MKTSLTIKIFTFLTVLLFTASLTAQLKFEVTSPAGIAGTYDMAPAGFGGEFPDICNGIPAFTGELMIGDDGDDEAGAGSTTDACQALVNDLTGKFALIDRGACEFGLKCLNAEAAGADLIIVCNNDPAQDPFEMAPGVVGDMVTVPCLMIGKDDCDAIRVAIPTVEVSIYYESPPGTDNVLWGLQTGEADFNGGLNDWTTVDDGNCPNFELWRWSANGTATNGAFSAGGGVIQSNTACNGAMSFDSDFYDNNGDSGNLGGGDCPADQIGELISPTIDLATVAAGVTGVSLKFWQATRQFTSTYIVSYSNDDGASWNDIEINSEIEVNSAHLNQEVRVFLPDADLSTNTFKFKFRYEANYYYWIIDDVQLVETEANNLRVMSNFYAIAPNAVWPISQVEPYSHLADVYNAGSVEQTNVNLNVTITDDANNVVFSDDNPYTPIPADSLVENQPFPNYFTPDGGTPNTYEAVYTISSDSSDFDISDNTQSYTFITSDTTFAKEFGPTRSILPAGGNWDDGEAHSWAYGNYFYIVNGEDWGASSATFVLGNADDDHLENFLISIYLYKWDADTNEDGIMDPDERTRVAFAVYEIQGDETNSELITVSLNGFPSGAPGPVALESNQGYALMVEYNTQSDVEDFVLMAGEIDYGAMTLRSELDGIPAGAARYASVLGINGDLESEPYSTAGFNSPLAPVVRMNIASTIVGTEEQLDAANTLDLSPNPANNTINVKVDLVEAQDMVSIRILDVTGKLVMEQNYSNFQQDNLEYDVSQFANGAYFLHLITEAGMRAERFIVQH